MRRQVPRALAVGRDYVRRVYNDSADDNILFLAGGIAFNLLLVAVPFLLLIVGLLALLFNQGLDVSRSQVHQIIDLLLPPESSTVKGQVHGILDDILQARGVISLYSGLGFVFFSTRVFGSLRSALSEVFDIEEGRGILKGKLLDIVLTLAASALILVYLGVNAYMAVATPAGTALLRRFGIETQIVGGVGQVFGRVLSLGFIVFLFFSLYRYLPNRRIRWQPAVVGALTTAVLFELMRGVYVRISGAITPGGLYSGSLYVIVSLVFWVYYASVVFLVGGEVARAHEVRHVMVKHRETFG